MVLSSCILHDKREVNSRRHSHGRANLWLYPLRRYPGRLRWLHREGKLMLGDIARAIEEMVNAGFCLLVDGRRR